jgi:CHASE1-domain containing sensor protein
MAKIETFKDVVQILVQDSDLIWSTYDYGDNSDYFYGNSKGVAIINPKWNAHKHFKHVLDLVGLNLSQSLSLLPWQEINIIFEHNSWKYSYSIEPFK